MDSIKHKLRLLAMAKNWAIKSLTGWSDDAHRDLIARHGAVALPKEPQRVTATSMSAMQLEAALGDYETRGWVRVRGQYLAARDGAQATVKRVPADIAHIVRLWARLGTAKKVQAATRPALLAWCSRQVGQSVQTLDVLSTEQRSKLIEALKAWAKR